MASKTLASLTDAHSLDIESLKEFRAILKDSGSLLKGAEEFEEVKVESIPEQYLTVKVPTLTHINFARPTVHDAATLRSMIIGLSHQLSLKSANDQEVAVLRLQLDSSQRARAELQETLNETVAGLEHDRLQATAMGKDLEGQRNSVADDFTSLKEAYIKLEKQLAFAEAENLKVKRDLLELTAKHAGCADFPNRLSSVQQELKDSQKAYRSLQVERDIERKELDALKGALEHERNRLVSDKASLNKSLTSRSAEVDRLSEENLSLKRELATLKLASRGSDSDSKVQALESMLAKSFKLRDELRSQLEEVRTQSNELTAKCLAFDEKYKAQSNSLSKTIEQLKDDLAGEKQTSHRLNIAVSEQEAHITNLEQLVCVQEDFASLREDLVQSVAMHRLVKDETLTELDALSQYTIGQAHQNKTNADLLVQTSDLLREQMEEIDGLKYRLQVVGSNEPRSSSKKGDASEKSSTVGKNLARKVSPEKALDMIRQVTGKDSAESPDFARKVQRRRLTREESKN